MSSLFSPSLFDFEAMLIFLVLVKLFWRTGSLLNVLNAESLETSGPIELITFIYLFNFCRGNSETSLETLVGGYTRQYTINTTNKYH